MNDVAGATMARLVADYGALGILVVVLLVGIIFLYRQNLKLYNDNLVAHEKRVEDAKKFAADHASAIAQLEATAENLHELFTMLRDAHSRKK